MKQKHQSIWIHVGIIVLFLVVSCVYFSPILSGSALPQGDIQKYEGMAKAQKDYHKSTGDYSNWAPSMFSGMPGYQIHQSPQHSVFTPIADAVTLRFVGRSNDIGVLFLYLIGFYVALVALGASPWLALFGALAFGLGSYNIIIIEAGHITKARAMAMIAPILAGMILALRKRYVWGGILFTLALGLQIAFNHIQITFYTVIAALVLGVVYLVYALKDKQLKPFFMGVGVLLIGCALAFCCNLRHLMVNQEYAQYTMRGGKDITVTPKALDPNAEVTDDGTTTKGLDINYAFSWSYGVGETYTLLVPGAQGGGSGERVDDESNFYKNFHQNQAPLYWGDQPFTSGPVYFGAVIVFLFILGLFVVKGPERWWLLAATIIAIVMSWGRNAMGINGWLFENLPLYSKFRTPSMSLVIANVTMVLMAVLAVKALIDARSNAATADPKKSAATLATTTRKLNMALYISAGFTCLVLLVGMLLSHGFAFSGASDAQMAQQYGDQWQAILSVLVSDRQALFTADSWRSILFVLLTSAALWLFINNKVKKSGVVVAILALLVVFDLWGVDRRYLNDDNYTDANRLKLNPEQYDLEIDQQAATNGDVNYRVYNLATDTYNDSKPSAFHNQIGGYSAAKLRRYQDLIDFYINGRAIINHYQHTYSFDSIPVLDMLNTRYMVLPAQNGAQVMRRTTALGNAWFVDSCRFVTNSDAEILALNNFNPAMTAIVAEEFKDQVAAVTPHDSASTIVMDNPQTFNPSIAKYKAHCVKDELVVFSEIHYEPDWFVYIDGKPAKYIRANYVLRAMVVPAGDHVIEFRNEAPRLQRLDNLTLLASGVLVLLIGGTLFVYYRKKKNATPQK